MKTRRSIAALNELMYIRGVGNLRPEPRDSSGSYATYNADVVDSVLIGAVRSAYEGLIRQLEYSFAVDVVDAFDFVTRNEVGQTDPSPYRSPIRRVVAWTLEDAAELRAGRERDAAVEQDKQDRAELANVAATHGLALDCIRRGTPPCFFKKKPSGPAPSDEHVNRDAVKDLRGAGFRVDAGDVRRIRKLIERYSPEILPEALRSASLAQPPSGPTLPDNVVPLRVLAGAYGLPHPAIRKFSYSAIAETTIGGWQA
jgi:hypothetical protein